ncbi:hypothetical protein [Saccharothrix texasensis]|uniref:hypothetical protein n=1 Tax=Saccharothrix texasensis TaxID=103734 RepID=UPI001B883D0E|nr:hypothetical protein [Saccharothrix texasensis]
MGSKKIALMLPCTRDADGGPSWIATPRPVDDLTAERARIDRLVTDLVRSRCVLDEVIDAASGPRRRPSRGRVGLPVGGARPPARAGGRAGRARLSR